jgi:hypothetical protein
MVYETLNLASLWKLPFDCSRKQRLVSKHAAGPQLRG